jgi:hypothetical protein
MIGNNYIGTLGRLGNQMFQYAALKGIASNRGFEYTIPSQYNEYQIDNYGLLECFELTTNKNIGFIQTEKVIQEKHFHFDEHLFNNCPDNISLTGFFQTEKYFEKIKNQIKQDFTFKKDWLEPCLEFMSQFDGEEVGFLHVRRGDPNLTDKRGFKWAYVNLQDQHPVQTIEYYEKAIQEFSEDMKFLVFSDSIDWVKEQDFFKGERFMFSEPEHKYSDGALVPYIDLCLMSLCSHAIIANSSLSWWGAWLQKNPNKKIITPSKWFGPAYAQHDTKDLYCERWKII